MAHRPHDVGTRWDDTQQLAARLRELGLEVPDYDDRIKDLPSIQLPELKYGYPESPLTWDQLKTIIEVENDVAKLARSSSQQWNYELFRYSLKHEYATMLDYILVTKFDFARRRGEGDNDRLWRAFPQLNDYSKVTTRLVKNDFPYFMSDGIVHFVLWKTNDSIHPQDIEDAKATLVRAMNVVDTLHWINPPHLQSLPAIDHVHILCRLGDTTTM